MTKTRNLSDLLDSNGDVKSTALDNVPASNDASALTTGTLPNARLSAVPNSALANSSITINGTATALGGSATINTDLVNDTTPQLGGALSTNGNNINFGDDDVLNQGDLNEFSIRHEGVTGNTYIRHTTAQPLYIRADKLRITNSNLSETLIRADNNGDVQLNYDNAVKLATTSTGVSVTGTLTATAFDATGLVVQYVVTQLTGQRSWSHSAYDEWHYVMEQAITPKLSTSTLYCRIVLGGYEHSSASGRGHIKLYQNSSSAGQTFGYNYGAIGNVPGTQIGQNVLAQDSNGTLGVITTNAVGSVSNTTGATKYFIFVAAQQDTSTGNIYINRWNENVSYIEAWEVA